MENDTWYLIEWNYDSNEKSRIKEQQQTITFLDTKGKK